MRIRLIVKDDGNGTLRERTTALIIETGPHGVDIRRESEPRLDADSSVPVDVIQEDGDALTLVIGVESADG